MKFIYVLTLIALVGMTLLTGCKTDTGSREFIPGKGWVPSK